MTELLAIATILGGIAAVWFFWDKMQRRGKQDTPLEDPTPTGSKDDAHSNIAQELRDLASRPAVNLPKGSRVIGEPWPYDEEGQERIRDARRLHHRGIALLATVSPEVRDELTEALARFEQRIQVYEYGELAQVSLEREKERFEKLLSSLETEQEGG